VIRPSRWRRAAVLAVPLAAAAALVLVLGPLRGGGLPDYALEVEGGSAEQRGPSGPQAGPARFEPTARVAITARPETVPEATVSARAWLERDGSRWPLPVQPSVERGVVHLEGSAAALFGGKRGAYDLVLELSPDRGAAKQLRLPVVLVGE
jgi:hypothetical protein